MNLSEQQIKDITECDESGNTKECLGCSCSVCLADYVANEKSAQKQEFIRNKEHRSVLQDWVMENCSLRMQGALVSAIRGCDGVPKFDVSKKFVRALRSVVLNSPVEYATTFLAFDVCEDDIKVFLKQPDQYSMHWLFHFIHATEVVGFMHPDKRQADWWQALYYRLCDMLHMNPESREQLYSRLHDGDKGDCWKS